MLTIPMNMVEITSKKTAGKAKNDMLPEELNDIKLDIVMMRSKFIKSLLVDQSLQCLIWQVI